MRENWMMFVPDVDVLIKKIFHIMCAVCVCARVCVCVWERALAHMCELCMSVWWLQLGLLFGQFFVRS